MARSYHAFPTGRHASWHACAKRYTLEADTTKPERYFAMRFNPFDTFQYTLTSSTATW